MKSVVSILSTCTYLGLLDLGKEIQITIVSKGIELNEFVLNGLADMYVKCVYLNQASLIFGKKKKVIQKLCCSEHFDIKICNSQSL